MQEDQKLVQPGQLNKILSQNTEKMTGSWECSQIEELWGSIPSVEIGVNTDIL